MNKLYLEGTENILKNFSEKDKQTIIEIVKNLKINRPKILTKKVLEKVNNLECSKANALLGVNETILFYANNIPSGYKKVPESYDMSNEFGHCIRFNRRTITDSYSKKGYLSVSLALVNGKTRGTYKHRMVLEAWNKIENMENLQVNHIDTIKTNNNIANLEWCTNQENQNHARENGLYDTEKHSIKANGEKNSQSILCEPDVVEIRNHFKNIKETFLSIESLKYKTTEEVISKILNNELKYDLDRIKQKKLVKTNSKKETYYEKEVWSNKINQTNASIRGKYIKIFRLSTIELSKKFNVSEATIRDVVARRSWNYANL